MRYNIVIVGGGIAGLEAARRLLRLGYCPIIVERQDRLGGHVATWHCLFPDMSPAQETVSRLVEESSSANIFLGTKIRPFPSTSATPLSDDLHSISAG